MGNMITIYSGRLAGELELDKTYRVVNLQREMIILEEIEEEEEEDDDDRDDEYDRHIADSDR